VKLTPTPIEPVRCRLCIEGQNFVNVVSTRTEDSFATIDHRSGFLVFAAVVTRI
jgi:hypothetical protein